MTLSYYYLKHDNKQKFIYSQFKWVQVDEVQDLNPLQWAIIEEISAPDSLVVYFGDYEQAIFRLWVPNWILYINRKYLQKQPQKRRSQFS